MWRMLATVVCFWLLSMAAGTAHEVRPAVADVEIGSDQARLTIRLTAEALVAGINLDGLEDTNDAPEAAFYDRFRALSPEDMAERFSEAWPGIAGGINVVVDGQGQPLTLSDVRVGDEPELDLPRETSVTITATLPAGAAPVTVGWDASYGPLVVRQVSGDEAYSGYLTGGALSDPLPREGVAEQSLFAAFVNYVVIGFEHIVPKGLDHILFVLGLFLFSRELKPLVLQVSAFTVAHTVTLALATLGIVSIPASIVEPLIALSIVYVAVENILGGSIGWRRLALVFAFGLLHGLGFASVLGDIGLDPARFISGLIAFNIGVELGQLAVILVAFLALGLPFGSRAWYRPVIVIPLSAMIGLIGAWWAIERSFF